ncbi:MAG: DNA alkylation repair protein [Acidobacteria bacterium]|nr:DNA alkylation repair protein [Acidobacteriota bacterium]MBV9069527.1 DNA alkylation repair protein [Acidobacteriota bacterium]MBV9186973.1 DNA alkylation repair protein [Acidobacteriota bacterium]
MTARAIEARLRSLADATIAEGHLRFFKCGPGQYGESDAFLGINVPTLRTLSKEFTPAPVADLIVLLQSRWHEARLLALMILVRKYERETEVRDEIYRRYLANTPRINNWDLVDASAPNIVGAHLLEGHRAPLYALARSESLWERRIAIVATQHFIRHDDFDDTLRIAEILLDDRHDLIHKASGWMLREAGKRDRALLERFLRKHAKRMPRTMLRYAIERFPPKLRAQYMAR